jgi:hypothetical protein
MKNMSTSSMNAASMLADDVVEQDLFYSVRDPARVESVLQLAAASVIDDAHVPASLRTVA